MLGKDRLVRVISGVDLAGTLLRGGRRRGPPEQPLPSAMGANEVGVQSGGPSAALSAWSQQLGVTPDEGTEVHGNNGGHPAAMAFNASKG